MKLQIEKRLDALNGEQQSDEHHQCENLGENNGVESADIYPPPVFSRFFDETRNRAGDRDGGDPHEQQGQTLPLWVEKLPVCPHAQHSGHLEKPPAAGTQLSRVNRRDKQRESEAHGITNASGGFFYRLRIGMVENNHRRGADHASEDDKRKAVQCRKQHFANRFKGNLRHV